jgi:phosphoribosylformylglycinamidine cyclo-ligase
VVDTKSWELPPVFRVLQEAGGVERMEMFRAFNMGVGMVVIAPPAEADAVIASARAASCPAWVLGHVAPGRGLVRLT